MKYWLNSVNGSLPRWILRDSPRRSSSNLGTLVTATCQFRITGSFWGHQGHLCASGRSICSGNSCSQCQELELTLLISEHPWKLLGLQFPCMEFRFSRATTWPGMSACPTWSIQNPWSTKALDPRRGFQKEFGCHPGDWRAVLTQGCRLLNLIPLEWPVARIPYRIIGIWPQLHCNGGMQTIWIHSSCLSQ